MYTAVLTLSHMYTECTQKCWLCSVLVVSCSSRLSVDTLPGYCRYRHLILKWSSISFLFLPRLVVSNLNPVCAFAVLGDFMECDEVGWRSCRSDFWCDSPMLVVHFCCLFVNVNIGCSIGGEMNEAGEMSERGLLSPEGPVGFHCFPFLSFLF